jgi:NTP pyrophosphatase (non-canonical NTP hydrolase)
MKDLELTNPELFEMVKKESLRQIRKWGIQDKEPFEWLAYTTEELGELSCAILEYCYRGGLQSEAVKEAIQLATLALKIAEMFIAAPMAMWNRLPLKKIKCDRCGKEVEGIDAPGIATGGFYQLTGTCWQELRLNGDENVICDECMFADPKYIAIYGKH